MTETRRDCGTPDISPPNRLLAELYRECFKETMGHERWFGTLRARIAWAPATITLAVISFFVTRFPHLFWLSYLILVSVFVMIFVTNIHLERAQRRCRYICRRCACLVNQIANGKDVPFFNYGSIRDSAKCSMKRKIKWFHHDTPTISLFIFLATLGFVPTLAVGEMEGISGLEDRFQVGWEQLEMIARDLLEALRSLRSENPNQ